MNTPITDAVYPPDILDREYKAQGDTYGWGTLNKMRNTARRLELDRGTFRQALIQIYLSPAADSRALANAALQAASKFEGEERTP